MANARNGDVDAHPPWQEAMSEVIRVATSLTYGAGVLTSPAFTAALKDCALLCDRLKRSRLGRRASRSMHGVKNR
jgi:hypothetical protein